MKRALFVLGTLSLAAFAIGCQQPQIDMAEMMKPPPRPAELDRLDQMIGNWEFNGEMKVPGQDALVKTSGKMSMTWEIDRWAMLERAEFSMGDGPKALGLGAWTWDTKDRVYRMASYNNHDDRATGTATYDDATRTWHMKMTLHISKTDETIVCEGKAERIDDNTFKWTMTGWDSWKLSKKFEETATMKRRS